MGFRYSKRIGGNSGFGINLSGSGIASSYRTKFGTLGTKGFSIKTGIPGLTYRSGWRVGKKNRDIRLIVNLTILCIYLFVVITYNSILFFIWCISLMFNIILRLYSLFKHTDQLYSDKTEINRENKRQILQRHIGQHENQ